MKLFVTGGTGFVGSNFIELTNQYNVDTVALRRSKSIPPIRFSKEVNWIEGDLDSIEVSNFKYCTHYVHFASYGVLDQNNWNECLKTNVIDSLKAVEKAVEAGIQKFVIIGSCFEYGLTAIDYQKIPTTAPLRPVNAYSASKAAATISLGTFLKSSGKDFKILRLFHIFGEGEAKSRFWPSLYNAAINGENFDMTLGEQIRDFSNVKDAVQAIFDNLNNFDSTKNTFNIASGKSCSLKTFAEYWWKKLNAKGKLNFGAIPYQKNEIMRYIPDLEN